MFPFLSCLGKAVSLYFLIIALPFLSHAQRINNPSFEGRTSEGYTPELWENCGGPLSTPDTQPGVWGVSLPPDHGVNYLGLVFRQRNSGSFESVTQNLTYPFHQDSCYTFEISLAFDPDYEDVNSRQPGILKIWGGNGLCATTENLWNSPVIDHKDWRTYVVRFSPEESHTSITLQGYFSPNRYSFYNGDILVDNIRNIKAHRKTKLSLGNDIRVCGSSEYTIDASFASGPFLWQDGTTNSTYKVTKSGKYWVQTYLNGCKTADTINVTIEKPIEVDLGPDIRLCEGEQTFLSLSIPTAKYKWSNNSTSSAIKVTESGKYWVEVTRGTCTVTDTINVTIQGCRFYVPNIITPNGDNLNDVFEVIDDLQDSWRLEIYNRSGILIFSDNNYKNTWDGNGSSSGIYFYYLKSNTSSKTYKGALTISR
ncbi:gliding motility-associated C-terminal domain-containing protein [Pontibacter pamirensis]|uniref:gliding motility-associated C-terminal domain-containing protein n=1 Tax=Pontibacter pamirensis TaxID=2562824 RepID=UPI0013894430|nr:gliding motility-associated C-terminal domain-containing protein [Pontibacter pamirensis]